MYVQFGGKYKSFQKKVPANLEKIKSAFCGKHATSEMSFAPGMVTSPSNQTQLSKRKAIDLDKHVGDSDEANEDGSDADIECLGGKAATIPYQAGAGMAKATSPNFCYRIRFHYIHQKKEEKLFLNLDDEFVVRYMTLIGMDEEDCTMDEEEDRAIDTIIGYNLQRYHLDWPRSTLKERFLRAIGEESGANYIHILLSGNRLDLCREVVRPEKDVFTHLVSILMEMGLLKEGRFVKAAEIVAITLFILARGANYREAEDCFQRSPSTIGKYHKQVLDGLVQLFGDIVRPYQSQDELPTEIL
ncbi:hypothetical protein Cgig2_009718 [Carnegiea gigantea]|uniref:DUF8040 domain-containing protein n=1 Tax=Carnegiea gigantea TaxID=171969 RepID=A0A9Q1K4L9_9CARY|nr:hypothetical protein Cgig2_009718 [Carnegiea gigantea]